MRMNLNQQSSELA
jgi:hypothetical protein